MFILSIKLYKWKHEYNKVFQDFKPNFHNPKCCEISVYTRVYNLKWHKLTIFLNVNYFNQTV